MHDSAESVLEIAQHNGTPRCVLFGALDRTVPDAVASAQEGNRPTWLPSMKKVRECTLTRPRTKGTCSGSSHMAQLAMDVPIGLRCRSRNAFLRSLHQRGPSVTGGKRSTRITTQEMDDMATTPLRDRIRHPGTWNVLVAIVPIIGVLLTGCGRPRMGPPSMTPEVAVVAIQPQQVSLTTELPGRTCAYRTAEIRPQVNGLIQKRLFTEGARVKAGEVLYEVDPAPYVAAYNSAAATLSSAKQAEKKSETTLNSSIAALPRHEAALKLAKANLDRYELLMKKDAVAASEHDQGVADFEAATSALHVAQAQIESDRQSIEVAKAAVEQAEAALDAAKINLGYTKIVAPITGRIGRSNVTDGAIATAYQATALATIQQMDPIYVDVTQSTVELLRLKRRLEKGRLKASGTDKVKIVLEDGTEYPLEGSLQFADVTVEQTTGSVVLRIVVPNPDEILLPGMYVRAIIEEGVRDDAILVPQQAVSHDPKGDPITFVVDDKDIVQQRELVTDRSIGDKWLVSSGLDKGDRVIVEGIQKVRPGVGVKVVQAKIADTLATNPEDVAQTSTR